MDADSIGLAQPIIDDAEHTPGYLGEEFRPGVLLVGVTDSRI